MTVYRKGNKHFIFDTALIALILFISEAHTITTVVKAEFTPPNAADWLGSGETYGIFSSRKVIFNITSGTQYKPSLPLITFRSNTSNFVKLGNCVADFRLLRVENNGSLIEIDYARFTLNTIKAKEGVFWASRIKDYPSKNLIGVVIWNASDGSVVGRLIRTIRASDEEVLAIKSDKPEFGPSDEVSFTIVNHGPTVRLWGEVSVYREVNGTWRFVGPDYSPVIVDYAWVTLERNETHRFSVYRPSTDFSQSGVYVIIMGGDIVRSYTVFRVVGSGFSSGSELNRVVWTLAGASIGAILGLVVFYYSNKRAHTKY